MKRKIVHIDSEKCNGCGACVHACHENAIVLENGKARLIRDDYCDGLGDCLPACPTDAISIIEREAAAYDEAAVQARQAKAVSHGCPGMRAMALHPEASAAASPEQAAPSQLRQWPVQIKLAPIHAPYFQGAKLLIAADCTAYAFAGFHERFMKGRVTLVGCPKLDGVDYAEKLAEIIKNNDIQSVTVVRMEVPCCGGLEQAVKSALMRSGKFLPWQVVVLSTDGHILSE
ncbi:MAG: 4Fe-4S dicluster domain-containing protein [Eubacteriales bacterium]|nr:4Fe-4S dicluster domain-containing protein [Eubacteriales bacterium]